MKKIIQNYRYEKPSFTDKEIQEEIENLKDDNSSTTPFKQLIFQSKILTYHAQKQNRVTKFQLRITTGILVIGFITLVLAIVLQVYYG